MAAFFDLDKTVIAKSSTLAFSRPLYKAGLLNKRTLLKAGVAQAVYMMVGAVTESETAFLDSLEQPVVPGPEAEKSVEL